MQRPENVLCVFSFGNVLSANMERQVFMTYCILQLATKRQPLCPSTPFGALSGWPFLYKVNRAPPKGREFSNY